MPKLRVKTGDKVVVIAGKDKSKQGRILKVYPKEGRVVVEGVNIVKRHTKPNPQHPEGGIVEKEAPIHVSNVMIVDPKTGEPTRVGYKFLEDGRKVRYAKKSGEILD
ncbi:ribosomal protein L24 [Alicyclobacillus acidocaldarius subsp. acidocaldarius DSM 446]|uniref:Large ribosomal subunit protein uL24 n=1 Tax=Alicyclobacillus acidocaldarius subsp. acidocaldarius (strain ATCC 27009 / DSM 446 / BCRC 14685 / JCM 5260 / KCTC 1825 / NBRC 15652 / NCIMB 11725 / NRRL B-14509 / 104-IA) TaxID=521098 RepID=C8WTW2_ALIAD|nr:ribosomal protein L24 [Alicyclobacillus acidocaldarius subsp. acidocaldarius DSM 446]